MSTATIETGTEAVITRAREVLNRALDCEWPSDPAAREAVRDALWFLADSLKAYSDLRCGIVAPDSEFPGLEPGPEAFAEALAKVASDAGKDADELIRVMGQHGVAAQSGEGAGQ
jgi:hypothetical protein